MKKILILLFLFVGVLFLSSCKENEQYQDLSIEDEYLVFQVQDEVEQVNVVDIHNEFTELKEKLDNISGMERILLNAMLEDNVSEEALQTYLMQFEECIYLKNLYLSQFEELLLSLSED